MHMRVFVYVCYFITFLLHYPRCEPEKTGYADGYGGGVRPIKKPVLSRDLKEIVKEQ